MPFEKIKPPVILIVLFFVLFGCSNSNLNNSVLANTAVDKAVVDAGIDPSDSLDDKITKTLRLLVDEHYFQSDKPITNLPPPYDVPYQLDSMRTPEQILQQKIGGSCGSYALAFAAILEASGVKEDDVQLVWAVVNTDLSLICPQAGLPRVQNPNTGASGHVLVAIRFPSGNWELINTTDPSKIYERVPWINPNIVQDQIKVRALAVPSDVFKRLPQNPYAAGLTVFQSWTLQDVPIHTFTQRLDLIAAGDLNNTPAICRFTAPN